MNTTDKRSLSSDPFRPGLIRNLALGISWVSVLGLSPWIVYLYETQRTTSVVHHLPLMHFGMSFVLFIATFLSAVFARRVSFITLLFALSAATFSLITPWFSIVTTEGPMLKVAIIYAVIILLPLCLLSLILVRSAFHPFGKPWGVKPIIPSLISIASIIVFVMAIITSISLRHATKVDHLQLAWCGLDIFELIGLFGTAWCLWNKRPSLALFASFTGTLLLTDGWVNVIGTHGQHQLQALLMACVELPLSALAFGLSYCEIQYWPRSKSSELSPQSPKNSSSDCDR